MNQSSLTPLFFKPCNRPAMLHLTVLNGWRASLVSMTTFGKSSKANKRFGTRYLNASKTSPNSKQMQKKGKHAAAGTRLSLE